MPYFDDEGNEFNPDFIPKPSLCVGCMSDDSEGGEENVLCALTRFDQNGEKDFKCFAFVPKGTMLKSPP